MTNMSFAPFVALSYVKFDIDSELNLTEIKKLKSFASCPPAKIIIHFYNGFSEIHPHGQK